MISSRSVRWLVSLLIGSVVACPVWYAIVAQGRTASLEYENEYARLVVEWAQTLAKKADATAVNLFNVVSSVEKEINAAKAHQPQGKAFRAFIKTFEDGFELQKSNAKRNIKQLRDLRTRLVNKISEVESSNKRDEHKAAVELLWGLCVFGEMRVAIMGSLIELIADSHSLIRRLRERVSPHEFILSQPYLSRAQSGWMNTPRDSIVERMQEARISIRVTRSQYRRYAWTTAGFLVLCIAIVCNRILRKSIELENPAGHANQTPSRADDHVVKTKCPNCGFSTREVWTSPTKCPRCREFIYP